MRICAIWIFSSKNRYISWQRCGILFYGAVTGCSDLHKAAVGGGDLAQGVTGKETVAEHERRRGLTWERCFLRLTGHRFI